MRTPQTSITYPKKKLWVKKELKRRVEEDCLNESAFIVSLLEREFGYSVST
jgi:hypothetical protein|tara:strand:+ start:2772 stop:2924 length:153 start_codon:yes stop_codon:yes gene_type:complete